MDDMVVWPWVRDGEHCTHAEENAKGDDAVHLERSTSQVRVEINAERDVDRDAGRALCAAKHAGEGRKGDERGGHIEAAQSQPD